MAVTFLGCGGGQPRLYKISIDQSPLNSLPATCYFESKIPQTRFTSSNLTTEGNWYVWDDIDSVQQLDLGNMGFPKLGDAEPIDVIDNFLVSGTDMVFTGTWTEQLLPQANLGNYSYTKTQSVTVTFKDMGATANGTIDLVSNYVCTNCINGNNDGKVSCATTLNFTGRRIDSEQLTAYGAP